MSDKSELKAQLAKMLGQGFVISAADKAKAAEEAKEKEVKGDGSNA